MANVKRNGEWKRLAAREIVPGDVISVKLGDIIGADGYMQGEGELEVDESSLTGESLPVVIKAGAPVRSGGIVKKGHVEIVVEKTGINTYIGEAVNLVATQEHHESRLQTVLVSFARILIIVSIIG